MPDVGKNAPLAWFAIDSPKFNQFKLSPHIAFPTSSFWVLSSSNFLSLRFLSANLPNSAVKPFLSIVFKSAFLYFLLILAALVA